MADCPDCGRPFGEGRYSCRSSLNDLGLIDCLRHQAARERSGNEQTRLILDLERSYTSDLKAKLAAAKAKLAAADLVIEAAKPIVASSRDAQELGAGLGLEWATAKGMGVAAFDQALTDYDAKRAELAKLETT